MPCCFLVPGAGLIQDLLQRFLPPKVRPGARPAQGLGDTAGDVSFASGEVLQQLLCRIRVRLPEAPPPQIHEQHAQLCIMSHI